MAEQDGRAPHRGPGADRLERAAPFVLAAVTLLGLGLRIPGFLSEWINPDEGIYYSAATWSSWSRFGAELASNVHPPLYFLLLRGLGALGTDIAVLRAPSLVFGVLAIPALFLATRELLGTGAGLLAALLVALSPGAIDQSQVIRPYTAQLAVLGFALFFLARFARRRATCDAVGWGTLLLVSVGLHYGSWLFAAAATGAAGLLLASGRLGGRDALRLGVAELPALAAAGVLFLVHVGPRLLGGEQLHTARATWLRHYFQHDLAGLGAGLVGVLRFWSGAPHDALALLLLAVGLGAAVWRRQWLLASLVVLGVGIGALLSWLALYPFGESRHSTWLVVLLLPCVAAGVTFAVEGGPRRRLAVGALLVLLALFPRPLRVLLRTDGVASHLHHEEVTPRKSVEQAEGFLRDARSRAGVVLVDEETFYVLIPFFHPARLAMRTLRAAQAPKPRWDPASFAGSHLLPDAVISRFPWGAAQVVVVHAWRMRAGPPAAAFETLVDYLRLADEAYPDLGLSRSREASFLFGGWSARFYQGLARFDRAEGIGCVSRFALRPGLGWARIDPARCLESGSSS